MNCCAEEQGESAPGSGGMGFKVVYNRMWCPGVFLESVIPVSGNSEIEIFFFCLQLVRFWPHGYLILSVLLRHR